MPTIPKPTIGRMVLFVQDRGPRRGEIRPATVTRVIDNGDDVPPVNLRVHLDGPNDIAFHGADDDGWRGTCAYDQDEKNPGTWHWMEYQIQEAAAPAAPVAPAASTDSPAASADSATTSAPVTDPAAVPAADTPATPAVDPTAPSPFV